MLFLSLRFFCSPFPPFQFSFRFHFPDFLSSYFFFSVLPFIPVSPFINSSFYLSMFFFFVDYFLSFFSLDLSFAYLAFFNSFIPFFIISLPPFSLISDLYLPFSPSPFIFFIPPLFLCLLLPQIKQISAADSP
jgi:hypothetical protein